MPGHPPPALLTAALAALAPAGCGVDDRMIAVTPDPIVIAAFERGTVQSDDAHFGAWSAYSLGGDAASVAASASPVSGGYNSNWCLGLDWQLAGPAGDAPAGAGAGAGTGASAGLLVAPTAPLDLSGYSRIVFSDDAVPDGGCAPPADLTVIVRCDRLGAALQATSEVSSNWATRSVDLAGLSWTGQTGASPRDCLRAASALLFQLPVDPAGGGCASGRLVLDNVGIR